MIFSVKQNTLSAYGTIWEGNGIDFVSIFSQLESQYEKIIVKIHTYGGSVFDGNLMYNALCNSKKSVELQIVGIAASMGAVMALSLDNVFMVENGYMMIHTCSGSTYGSASDHEKNAKLLRAIEKNFLSKLMKKTGQTESYVKKWLEGDNWFDAESALKEGLIKGIINSETDIETFDPQQLGVTESYNRFSALLIPENTRINPDNNMKKPIIQALALQGVTEQSSDTAVIEAVKEHFEANEAKLRKELKAEKDLRIEAERKLEEQGSAEIKATITEAKKQGKITAEQEATYEGIAKASGVEALKTVLAAIPVRTPIASRVSSAGGNDNLPQGRETWDWDKWQKEDPKGIEALAKENPEAFQELYNLKYRK